MRALSDGLGRALVDLFNGHGIEGGGWTHHAPERSHFCSTTLFHPSGIGIGIRHGNRHRKGDAGRRLTVEGIYPLSHSGPRAESITVGMSQSPARIFSEIRRRVLPDYLKTISAALEAAADSERARQARMAMKRRLEQVLPDLGHRAASHQEPPSLPRSHRPDAEAGLPDRPAVVSCGVKLRHDATSMDITLSDVPAELAFRLLALLDPRTALEGVIVPHEGAPPAIDHAPHTIQGEVIGPGEQSSLP
ncbi:hypothetical protein OG883_44680 [Streptomyces sp. NBC_01142]|uniref:hypothetical protein n=1 Tax=Streptomyces sp. NBC_01142 TaxID=2975865 RepID=UPI00225563F5|nr:hypothetical protein [Streptomyces sp. NBC_01142]MCX4826742.1 hypothetical protein [Streptomyces sp. NBC_01142]